MGTQRTSPTAIKTGLPGKSGRRAFLWAGQPSVHAASPAVAGEDVAPVSGFTTADLLLRANRAEPAEHLPVSTPLLHLLVVDEDEAVLHAIREIATQMGFAVRAAANLAIAERVLAEQPLDLVLLDLRPSQGSMAFLARLRKQYPRVPIVVMTAFASVNSVVEPMRSGASDYLTKPFALSELTGTLRNAAQTREFDLESRRVQEQLLAGPAARDIASASPAMQRLLRMVSRVSTATHPLLVTGESGSGKEKIARMLHGVRNLAESEETANAADGMPDVALAQQPAPLDFLLVDCAATPPAVLETELFGFVRNEGTADRRDSPGLLAREEGGTLYLDAIDAMPLELQAKLLRALQEKQVRAAGSSVAMPVRVRVVAATGRDLPGLVERGAFRKDLYFRLNVVTLRVPPLRERLEDIPVLATVFLERYSRERGLSLSIGPDAMAVLVRYAWPGNVRELEVAMERACASSSGPVLHVVDFPTQLQNEQAADENAGLLFDTRGKFPAPGRASSLKSLMSIADMEKQAIAATISRLNGDKLMAAKVLGIGKTTLYRKLKEYGIEDI